MSKQLCLDEYGFSDSKHGQECLGNVLHETNRYQIIKVSENEKKKKKRCDVTMVTACL